MPLYDFACQTCAHVFEAFRPIGDRPDCPICGGAVEKVWIGKGSTVIGDEMDQVIENNGTAHAIRFRSKSALAAHMAAHGLVSKVRHMPLQGSDKSPHTSDWSRAIDPYTLNNVRVLLSRVSGAARDDPAPSLPIDTSITLRADGIRGKYRA